MMKLPKVTIGFENVNRKVEPCNSRKYYVAVGAISSNDVDGKSDGDLYACACNALCAMFMRCRSHALAAARIPFRHLYVRVHK